MKFSFEAFFIVMSFYPLIAILYKSQTPEGRLAAAKHAFWEAECDVTRAEWKIRDAEKEIAARQAKAETVVVEELRRAA